MSQTTEQLICFEKAGVHGIFHIGAKLRQKKCYFKKERKMRGFKVQISEVVGEVMFIICKLKLKMILCIKVCIKLLS